jgi:hypothetical protein
MLSNNVLELFDSIYLTGAVCCQINTVSLSPFKGGVNCQVLFDQQAARRRQDRSQKKKTAAQLI